MHLPDRYEPTPSASADGLDPATTAENAWRELLARHDVALTPALGRAFVHGITTVCDWCSGSGQGSDYGGGPCYGCNGGSLFREEDHAHPQTVEDCLFFAGQGSRLAEAEALALEAFRRASALVGATPAPPQLARWSRWPFVDSPWMLPDSTTKALAWLASHGESIPTGESRLEVIAAAAEAFARVKARGATDSLDPFEPLLAITTLGYAFASDRNALALTAARVTPELPWIARSGTVTQLKARLVTDPYPTVITIGRLQRRELESDVLDLVWRSEPKMQRAALFVVSSLRPKSAAMRFLHELLVDRGAARTVREAALDTMYRLEDKASPRRTEGAFEDSIDWNNVQQLLAAGGLTLPARPEWFEVTHDVTRVVHTRFFGDREQELVVRRAGRIDVTERVGGQQTTQTMPLAHGAWTRLMTSLVAAGFPSHTRSDTPSSDRTVIAWQCGNSITTITLHDAGRYAQVHAIVEEMSGATALR